MARRYLHWDSGRYLYYYVLVVPVTNVKAIRERRTEDIHYISIRYYFMRLSAARGNLWVVAVLINDNSKFKSVIS